MKRIYFTVTNDLSFDRRMIRICSSLAMHGYAVTLIGRKSGQSVSLPEQNYRQRRIPCFFTKGKLFYLEYNIKLLVYLLFKRKAILCAIDLDTILPVLLISALKGSRRVYDAHELFTEMKEVITRPAIYRVWSWVERTAVPRFKYGYTVSRSIAGEFNRRYGVSYGVIANIPPLGAPAAPHDPPAVTKVIYGAGLDEISPPGAPRILLYQGAVNEARGLEYLIPAMASLQAVLWICGDGNFMQQSRQLVKKHGLEHKVIFKGMLLPEELRRITPAAYMGINLIEPPGLNQVYSLANKYFDYIHAAVPQLTMNFPEYAAINEQFEVALLLDALTIEGIVEKINFLLDEDVLYEQMRQNCLKAREIYKWEKEEMKLLELYKQISR